MSCYVEFDKHIRELFAECEHWRHREAMHDYQADAVEFLKLNPFSALFIDLGLGKSVISLTAILDLIGSFEADCVLVIGPLRVVNETWPTEIRAWHHTCGLSYAHIRDEDVIDQVNSAAKEARELMKRFGVASPKVRDLVHLMRKTDVKRRLKQKGYNLRQKGAKQLIESHFDAVKDAPLSAAEKKEFEKFSRRVAAYHAVREHKRRNPAAVYLINREQVEFLVDAWGEEWPYDTVFIDESSSLKDHKTNRFKALAKVRRFIKRMHQLTATPAAETYLHLFAQMYLLDQGQRLGDNYNKFCERYFNKNSYTFKYTLKTLEKDGVDAKAQIAEAISDICLTMKRADYLLSLQDPVHVVHKVVMDEPQQQLYRQMEEDSYIELGEGVEIEAETAAALSQKLLQMASGMVYETRKEVCPITDEVTKRRVVHHLHNHKIEKLLQLREEACGTPILVGYHHQESLERLKAAFPEAVVLDAAGTQVKAWNKGKIPMLLLHPQSGGHGLNLQYGGHTVVWFDLPWSLELYQQFNGRLDRQGQVDIVTIHHLVCAGTLDEFVLECLRNKADMQEELFKLLKRMRERINRKKAKQQKIVENA